MDFKDSIFQLAKRVSDLKESILTEEATKNAFIMHMAFVILLNLPTNLQLFSDFSNNLPQTIAIIFHFLTKDDVAKCNSLHNIFAESLSPFSHICNFSALFSPKSVFIPQRFRIFAP